MSNFIYGIIYKATLKLDGRIYIGQTTKQLKKRISEHKNASKKPKFDHFHNAIKKYGFDNFEWEIIEECYSKEELNLEEDKFINLFGTRKPEKGFNLKSGGNFGKHSEETKQIISEGKKGHKNGMYGKTSWNKGKKLSEQHKNNIKTKFKKGNVPWNKGKTGLQKRTIITKKTKEKISKANSGENNGMSKLNWEKIREIRDLYDNTDIGREEIAKKYGISKAYLSSILNNKRWRE